MNDKATNHYHDIGDYLTREQKLARIREFGSAATHKESGIVNDPNLWCDEHGNPRYIIDLLKRVVTLSVETMKIVKALPKLAL